MKTRYRSSMKNPCWAIPRRTARFCRPLRHWSARAPLLLLQGENDIRVPKGEAEQAVRILCDAGKTVDVHYYPTEGHGFVKRENHT